MYKGCLGWLCLIGGGIYFFFFGHEITGYTIIGILLCAVGIALIDHKSIKKDKQKEK